MTREIRSFSSEFKLQMGRLYKNGKPRKSIKQHQNTGLFNHQDNLSDEEKELIKLRKEVQHLRIENDILKQEALIMGRKKVVILLMKHLIMKINRIKFKIIVKINLKQKKIQMMNKK
ncbi:transposase [Staphylococcus aureus]